MPDTSLDVAAKVAERLRGEIEKNRFHIAEGERAIEVTVSIGLAERGHEAEPRTPLSPGRPGALPVEDQRPQSRLGGRRVKADAPAGSLTLAIQVNQRLPISGE